MPQLFCFLPLCFPDDVPAAPRSPFLSCPAAPPFSLAPFFSSASIVSRLSSVPSMIRLPLSRFSTSPSPPVPSYYNRVFILFFINRKCYDDYDRVWKLWIKERLRNPPKVIHSYCRFIPILIHKAGVAERRYCSGI